MDPLATPPDGAVALEERPPPATPRAPAVRRARRERRRRERRRVLARIGAGVGVAAAVVIGGVVAVGRQQGGEERAASATVPARVETRPTTTVPVPPGDDGSALVVHLGSSDEVVGVTVLVVDAAGGGRITFVPAATLVEIPSIGLDTLAAAGAAGGPALLQSSLENVLGTRLDEVVAVGPDALAALVAPAGTLSVELEEALERVGRDARVEVVVPAGSTRIGPEALAPLLAEPGTGSELDRLVRHQAFWEAWLAEIAEDPRRAGPPERVAGPVAAMVERLAGGDVAYSVLPVEAVSGGGGGSGEVYAVDDDALEGYLGSTFDGAVPPGERFRVELLNGTGSPGLTRDVPALLVPTGAEITATGNADRFDHQTTSIVYHSEDDLEAARSVLEALGVGEVLRDTSGVDVFDVTVVVGADYARAHSGAQDEDPPEGGDAPPERGSDN